jgi:hypothetical protein
MAWDGRPESPERDGWHWFRGATHECVGWWSAEHKGWALSTGERLSAQVMANCYRYLGPCILPSDHTVLVAERDALRAELARARVALHWEPSALATARAEGWKAGQEDMRNVAANATRHVLEEVARGLEAEGHNTLAGAMRAIAPGIEAGTLTLPLTPAPQEPGHAE